MFFQLAQQFSLQLCSRNEYTQKVVETSLKMVRMIIVLLKLKDEKEKS